MGQWDGWDRIFGKSSRDIYLKKKFSKSTPKSIPTIPICPKKSRGVSDGLKHF